MMNPTTKPRRRISCFTWLMIWLFVFLAIGLLLLIMGVETGGPILAPSFVLIT